MNYSAQILTALQEYLDVVTAFPVVNTMSPQTVELFCGSLYEKLQDRMEYAMVFAEDLVEQNDALGLAIHMFKHNVHLPAEMMLEICRDIISKSRNIAFWVMPSADGIPGQEGGLWHLRMRLDVREFLPQRHHHEKEQVKGQ